MRQIDGKYKTSGTITKLDDTPLPVDEPLVLFRGHDKVLPELLEAYKELCRKAGSPAQHLDSIDRLNQEIKLWQSANSDKTKVAD
jgi:hypothetical protein